MFFLKNTSKTGASKLSAIYKWLSIAIDFYGLLFVTLSWCFLSDHHNGFINVSAALMGWTDYDFLKLSATFPNLSVFEYLYFYKLLLLVLPLVTFCVFLLLFEFSDSIREYLWWQLRSSTLLFVVCYFPLVVIALSISMTIATCIGLVVAEFALFSWTAWFVEVFFNDRYQWLGPKHGVFWTQIVDDFLLKYRNNEDLCWRLCVVNFVCAQSTESEWVKRMFVDFNSWIARNEYRVFHDKSYVMSLETLRRQFGDNRCQSAPTMMGSMVHDYGEHIRNLDFFNFREFAVNVASFLILFVGIPLYILSRIATLVYPLWCIGFLIGGPAAEFVNHSVHRMNWRLLPMFNWTATLIYGTSVLVLCVLGYRLYHLMHILWHIMPGRRKLVKSLIADGPYSVQLNAMYDFHINRPVVQQILCRTFSNDVGNVIMLYMPRTYTGNTILDDGGSGSARRKVVKRYPTSCYSTPSSSSAHLAIDCVDPLPASFAKYDSTENTLKYKDFDGFIWYQFDTDLHDPTAS